MTSCPALLALALLLAEPPVPSPTAGPARPAARRLVGALESIQGDGKERVALFEDGTLVQTVTFRDRSTQKRKLLSAEEVEVVRSIAVEAASTDGDVAPSGVLTDSSGRQLTLEVVGSTGRSRMLRFDDMSSLPLAVGRARGAFEELKSRFVERDVSKEDEWDPACVVEGMVLRRRTDGLSFRVTRDDRFERGVELEEDSRRLERVFVLRESIPQLFEAPPRPRPTPTKVPRP